MLSNAGSSEMVVFTVNLVVVAISIRWNVALVMIAFGLVLGMQFYQYYTGASVDSVGIKVGSFSFILYTLLLIGTAVVIFLKPTQEQQELIEKKVSHLGDRITDREEALIEALAAREKFISNITHEFHAPMTGITSMAETLYYGYDKFSDKQRREAAEVIFKSSIRLDSYYNNIIDLAKLSSKDHNLKMTIVDLSALVLDRLELCRKIYVKDEDSRVFESDVPANITAYCDIYYISQTIDNLIINAINYCHNGKISISLKSSANYVKFTIEDEGIGIPKNEVYTIFSPFVVSSRTMIPSGGRGVGLALCKKVIEVHDGKIEATSDGEKGAIFCFTIPTNNPDTKS
jgi:signal transduction histidine kinase